MDGKKFTRGQIQSTNRKRNHATRVPTPIAPFRSPSPELHQSNNISINITGSSQVAPIFASVHRPRQFNAVQQRKSQQKCDSQPIENIAQQSSHHQAMAVPIPFVSQQYSQQQLRYPGMQKFQTNSSSGGQYYQQKQQHQQRQQPFIPPELQQSSRIPTVTPNFNQISKTATNILNDIYEKHLLSQTTFENVNAINLHSPLYAFSGLDLGAGRPGSDFNFNNLSHQQHHQQQQFTRQQATLVEINKNQNQMYGVGCASTRVGNGVYIDVQQQQQSSIAMRNSKMRLPRKISADNATKVKRIPLNVCDRPVMGESSRRPPTGGNEPDIYDAIYAHRTRTDVNLLHGTSELGAQQSKQFISGSGGNGSVGGGGDGGGSSVEIGRNNVSAFDATVNIRADPLGGNFSKDSFSEYIGCANVGGNGGGCGVVGGGNVSTSGGVGKYEHRNSKINIMLETAQAMAAAAYFARAAQRMANNNAIPKSRVPDIPASERGGYCGALQRAPPSMPAGLARRLANKDNFGMGKVKVMLRISDAADTTSATPHFMSIDKKKRQVTLTDPTTYSSSSTSQERGPMVAAPKMFAFDGLFTVEDPQMDICSSSLSEVIPAVLEGSDGCFLTLGYPSVGQSKTMLGSVVAPNDLGAIPCAISWLYKGISERRQKSGSRFSVRVSALGVSATKPGSSAKDLLAAHKTESDESPSSYLRDDFLGGPTELRAPTAERAALFLDAALAGRHQSSLEPALIFTLHVYQYSLGGKGHVAGGRSRLHLIDLGGCANRSGGLSLSGLGNVLLAILSGQRHPPNREHPLTPLLKDCLAPLTCHVSVLAHVSHAQTHTDALTTIQLASRIHRMRRKKHRFPMSSEKVLGISNSGHQSGSSEGPDPSSSDLSADTVIYMGPGDDATDGEHPPVYIPSLNSIDSRCTLTKVLKNTTVEKPSRLPQKKSTQKPQSPVPAQRTDSLKHRVVSNSSPIPADVPSPYQYSPPIMVQNSCSLPNSPKMIVPTYKPTVVGISKGSNVPTPKGSPLRRSQQSNQGSPKRQATGEEQWIDGPRLSKSKVAEARYLMREINHVKQREQWIDGPNMSPAKSLAVCSLPIQKSNAGYGFMDSHKKTMIRQWVENQSSQLFQPNDSSSQPPRDLLNIAHFKSNFTGDDSNAETITYTEVIHSNIPQNVHYSETTGRLGLITSQEQQYDQRSDHSISLSLPKQNDQKSERSNGIQKNTDSQEEEDQDSGPSEIPPALPLIEPLSSREISHDSLHIICSRHVSRESLGLNGHPLQTKDCGLQVTEDDIAKTMGEHPLSALSQGNVSVISSFNQVIGDAYSDCNNGDRQKHQFDQLARLREIFTSQLAMAEVVPAFRINDACSVFSEPAYRFIAGPGSVCSEPAYRPPSPRCSGCRQSIGHSRTPSQTSLPSLNGIVAIAGMEQYASLRHPDGASDPNLQQKTERKSSSIRDSSSTNLQNHPSIDLSEHKLLTDIPDVAQQSQLPPQLPPLPLSTPEAYDSGHDSSTPRTSKHSGISRRAESGYHSVATARDSDESSYGSAAYKGQRITAKKRNRQDKSLCNWLRNPFTCTYPDTEGEISDF